MGEFYCSYSNFFLLPAIKQASRHSVARAQVVLRTQHEHESIELRALKTRASVYTRSSYLAVQFSNRNSCFLALSLLTSPSPQFSELPLLFLFVSSNARVASNY